MIRIPRPVMDYCTTRVLTMDYVDGCKITALSPLARLELNGTQLASQLFSAYLKQVLLDGVFHADPHPGNVFLTDDGHIALIDLGMVGHTTPGMRENLLQLLLAVSERDSEAAADIVVGISQKSEDFDRMEFRRRLGQLMALQQDEGLQQLNVGRSLLEVSRNASDNGLMVPPELTLLGKTLLQLDEVGKVLDPTFDPNSAIKRDVSDLIWRRMKASFNQQTVFNSVLEAKGFMKSLPTRINKLMDSITNAEFEVRIKGGGYRHADGRYSKNRQSPHYSRDRVGGVDRGSSVVDSGANPLRTFWLSGTGDDVFPGCHDRRLHWLFLNIFIQEPQTPEAIK